MWNSGLSATDSINLYQAATVDLINAVMTVMNTLASFRGYFQ